jgi:hypothetical protein
MTKSVLGFTLIALCAVGLGLFFFLEQNKGAHMVLEGSIKKVRVLELEKERSLLICDFRLKNPADYTFDVKQLTLDLTTAEGNVLEGMFAANNEAERIFEAYPALGQQFNPVLFTRQKIEPGQTVDRMVAVSYKVPVAVLESRTKLVLQVDEVNRMITKIEEKR